MGEAPFGLKSDPEARRLRIQGALWLAMALCRQQAVTLTYQHENLNNILRLAPPGSERGGWTSTIVWTPGDGGVFEGWDRLMTSSGGKLSNRDRDRLMVKECAGEHLVLVTRDATVLKEAPIAGVDAGDPETIAARTMTREDARTLFTDRLIAAANRYIARGALDERELRLKAMARVEQLFAAIWTPASQPWFPPARK